MPHAKSRLIRTISGQENAKALTLPELHQENKFPGAPLSPGGAFFIVGMPIGNPEDISLRALRVLREVDFILAENSTLAQRTLAVYSILKNASCFLTITKASETQVRQLLSEKKSMALICDRGLPGFADPGSNFVSLAIAMQARVVIVPGPIAATAALSASGLLIDRFSFEGFPPKSVDCRKQWFQRLADECRTMVFYENASSLQSTLKDLLSVAGPKRAVVVAQEVTTPKEFIFRGTLFEAIIYFRSNIPRRQITLIMSGLPSPR